MKTMFAVVLATVFLAFVSATPKCPSNQEDVVLVPNPDDCASYYACDGGVAYLMNCSAGLLFNPELRVCDWADNVTCSIDPASSEAPNAIRSEESNEVPVEEPKEESSVETSEERSKEPSKEHSKEPSKEHSKEPNEESSEEIDEVVVKIPNTKPCEASSESSEESDELSIYK